MRNYKDELILNLVTFLKANEIDLAPIKSEIDSYIEKFLEESHEIESEAPTSVKTGYIRGNVKGEYEFVDYTGKEDKMFYDLCLLYAFEDCVGAYDDDFMTPKMTIYKGERVCYNGWEPGMVFTFVNMHTGDIVYQAQHEEWDH